MHVNDNPESVAKNRALLKEAFQLPADPVWLTQGHGTKVIELYPDKPLEDAPTADGSISFYPNQICAVLTADCLPVLITNNIGTKIAAIHAGWKGLAAGILENGIQAAEAIQP